LKRYSSPRKLLNKGQPLNYGTRVSANQHSYEDDLQIARDERSFWYRRFYTSLSLGHATGFLAISAGVLQSDNAATIAKAATLPMSCFGAGLLLSGLVPGVLSIFAFKRFDRIILKQAKLLELLNKKEKFYISFLTSIIMILFAFGVITSSLAIYDISKLKVDSVIQSDHSANSKSAKLR
jgi:hypothetical protein